jgi:hypothetical protein
LHFNVVFPICRKAKLENLLERLMRAAEGVDIHRVHKEDKMNFRDIPPWEFISKTGAHRHDHGHTGHAHFWQRAMSRRQFTRTAAGAAAFGAVLGSGLSWPGLASAYQSHEPKPIPGGTPVLGGAFHVFGPGLIDPADAEPSSITDFNGFIGLAFISGMVTRTNTKTGEVRTLPFVNSDMRFMKGVFKGTDGRTHQGAFAFV